MDNDRWPHCHVCNSEFFPFCARGDCPGSKALETPAAAPSAPAQADVPTEQAATLMKLIRAAWAGDRRIAEAYGTLLADRMDADEPGRGRYVRQMLEVLRGERPEVFVHAVSSPAPAEVPMPEPDVYWSSYRHGAEPVEIRSHSTPQLLAYAAAREAAAVERVRGVLRELVEANDALSGYRPPHDDELDRVARAWAAARAELGEKP